MEIFSAFRQNMFQLRTSSSFLAMTRKISKGVKISTKFPFFAKHFSQYFIFNPFSATRRYKHHQNKVKVKGLGRKSSYLAGFSIFFSHGSMKKLSVGKKKKKKKKLLKIFLSSRKTEVG